MFVATPSQQVALEGTTITLECAANGNPKPTILWLKDGVAIDLAPLDSRYTVHHRTLFFQVYMLEQKK